MGSLIGQKFILDHESINKTEFNPEAFVAFETAMALQLGVKLPVVFTVKHYWPDSEYPIHSDLHSYKLSWCKFLYKDITSLEEYL